jgi:hypothetical protein
VCALSACGGGSSDASNLLKQTFSGSHTVNSGNLSFVLVVTPSGSSTLSGPITLSFGGPFQNLGTGKLPESNFNISLSALGRTGSMAIISTGTTGYITLKDTSYQLPAATFQRLESTFASVGSSPGSSGSSGALGKLGIKPLRWITNPSVAGTEDVSGIKTTHIRAGINVSALLDDLNTFLEKGASLGISGASQFAGGIPAATKTRIASEVRNPRFDVWTGTSDKTVRKLSINLTLPVSGQVSSLLGGLKSAQIALSMQYANLNQPQTIQVPGNIHPFSEFSAKLRDFLGTVAGLVPGGAGSGSTGTSTPSPSPSPQGIQNYSQCIQSAHGDVTKMQGCAALLGGK